MGKNSLQHSPGPAASDAAGIHVLAARWEHAWNCHDAASLAGLVEDDVDFVTVSGRWLQGRREFHDWHRFIHEAHLKASSWCNRAFRARRLGATLSLVPRVDDRQRKLVGPNVADKSVGNLQLDRRLPEPLRANSGGS
jgi:hypothetical protein